MFTRCLHLSVLTSLGAVALTGCRSTGNDRSSTPDLPISSEKENPGPKLNEEGTDDTGAEELNGEDAKGTGPKIMGFQYFTRNTYSIMQGTYSDDQNNGAIGRTKKSGNIKIPGKRYVLEHYPVVVENYPRSEFGYSLFEVRDERPDRNYWDRRLTLIALMGYVLPKSKLIAPVVGLHAEINQVSLHESDSPEVAKSDIRAWILGVNSRQKIWGTGKWLGCFYSARLHLLNLGFPSNGHEYEVGLGLAMAAGFFRTDLSLSYLSQTYYGKMLDPDGLGRLKVTSKYNAILGNLTIWI